MGKDGGGGSGGSVSVRGMGSRLGRPTLGSQYLQSNTSLNLTDGGLGVLSTASSGGTWGDRLSGGRLALLGDFNCTHTFRSTVYQ